MGHSDHLLSCNKSISSQQAAQEIGSCLLRHPIHRIECIVGDGLAIRPANFALSAGRVILERSDAALPVVDLARAVPFIVVEGRANTARICEPRHVTHAVIKVASGGGIS